MCQNLIIKREKHESLWGGACVCVCFPSAHFIISYGGKNVPLAASIAMVTARGFLGNERQPGDVRSLCNLGLASRLHKFLFLVPTCSWMAHVPFFTSSFLNCRMSRVLPVTLKTTQSRKSNRVAPASGTVVPGLWWGRP